MAGMEKTKIHRKFRLGVYPFSRVFAGFENVGAVQAIFGSNTEKVLGRLHVGVRHPRRGGYMWIEIKKKRVACSVDYLKSAPKRYLYLDVIHELVHIRQLRQGKNIFDRRYKYFGRPTEIEAYRLGIKEAKKMGMSNKQIVDYLKVEWATKKNFTEFLKRFGLVQK